jgi:rubrerythrin
MGPGRFRHREVHKMSEERDDKSCKIIALRKAIEEEFDAANTYTKLMEIIPEEKDIITEILHDEVNHQGRLIDILFKLAPDEETECFNKGLKQEEND